jgi:aryl-alcohol dehydrogenase-like predicted oxidoreductase
MQPPGGLLTVGSDLVVSRLGYGAMQLTGRGVWGEYPDRAGAIALLRHVIDAGITFIDTADAYGPHTNETLIHEALFPYPADLVIATKGGFIRGGPGPGHYGAVGNGEYLRQCAYLSARRLGVERIDLYYLHEFDPSTPLEETLEALETALAAGKIARFGVSNATLADLEAVIALTTDGPLATAFTHVQNGFNRLETGDLEAVIPLVRRRSLRYVAFSPLAGGLLSGKYQLDRPPEPGTRLDAAPAMYEHLMNPSTFEAIADLQTHANVRGWTLPAAALRFILDTPGVDSLIIAPRSVEQFAAYGIGESRYPRHGHSRA